ncbi:hypothetical protein LCGC14_2493410 [marine sediment metagenome]|uniref:Uncharacterized protein n=1 Tax=marine sediment metagenome TaxID=412755 RepID=A0A0F9DXT0_9ZZZZ
MSVEFQALLNYDTTQENISIKVDQPILFDKIIVTNNQSEQVKLLIFADKIVNPELLLTADTILKTKPHGINFLISGVNAVLNDPIDETIIVNDTLKISFIGSGAGVCAIILRGKYGVSSKQLLLDELAQVSQVSKDQVGQATPGSEYFKTKRSDAVKQLGK